MKNEIVENKKHFYKYDLMRLAFILMTLGVHVTVLSMRPSTHDFNYFIRAILSNFFIICNPLFFMLSGRLNLDKEFNKKEDYINFYKKKFISIIIPFFVISLIFYLFFYYNNLSILDFLNRFITDKIEPDGTYWFMYSYIAILIFSPFYSKMVKNMNKSEKKLFLIFGFIVNSIVTILLFFNIKTAISFDNLGIICWHFYYFAGYLIEDLFKEKYKRIILYVLGVLSLISTIVISFTIKGNYILTNPGLLLSLQAFAIYIFFNNLKDKKENIVRKTISFLSKYVFVFYLLHMAITKFIIQNLKLYNTGFGIILIYIDIFIIVILISIILQTVLIKPIQKLIGKIINKEKNNKEN